MTSVYAQVFYVMYLMSLIVWMKSNYCIQFSPICIHITIATQTRDVKKYSVYHKQTVV